MVLSLTTQSIEDTKALKEFLTKHPGIETEEIQMADMYDEEGNFGELSMVNPGLPVTTEYMNWYIEKAKHSIKNGLGMTLDEVKAIIKNKRAHLMSNR